MKGIRGHGCIGLKRVAMRRAECGGHVALDVQADKMV